MSLKLFNTLSQTVEPFHPLRAHRVGMYTCGPTVYHFVHIGNFRTFVFQDVLRRHLKYRGFDLTHVMNITDVDDKIIANAGQAGLAIGEYTEKYTQAFLEDMDQLLIERPEIMPRATKHIDEMVAMVQALQENGLTYQRDGSIYFRIAAFPSYGRLSRTELDAASQGRIDSDEYSKENPRDFVLWKARKEGEAYWETPLGAGRPGWHLECSAMSIKYLGQSFDIHCGGVDLVFPHHENEIAQSEGATGKPFVRHWIHGAHLIVEGEKMSKSRGNFYTLRDILDRGYDPRSVRYLLQSVHYRKQLNFSFEGLEQAKSALRRIDDLLRKLRALRPKTVEAPDLNRAIEQARQEFEAALDDDLNVSEALGALFELARQANIAIDEERIGSSDRDEILRLFSDANRIFAVFALEEESLDDDEVARLIEDRLQARRRRDYAEADRIRELLLTKGIILEDTREETRWKRA